MKQYIANIITSARILLSLAILLTTPCTTSFYILYITAGLTDMVDGTIARKTGSVSTFGSRLDTIADFIFVVCCLIKLLPFLIFPRWIYIWIAGIFLVKVITATVRIIRKNKDISPHNILNKLTGFMLFLLPLTIPFVELKYTSIVACAIATAAALNECLSSVIYFKKCKNEV